MLIQDIIPPKKEIKQVSPLSLKKFRRANKKKPRKILPGLLAFLLIAQMFLPVQIFFDPPRVEMREASAYGNGWLAGWDYRTPIEIDGNTEDLTNYQVQITLQGSNSSAANYVDFDKVLADGADIRFTDDDKITEIDFWIEEWVDTPSSESATVWLEVPSVLTAGTKTVYVYYGKSGVSAISNGDNTFEFFDDDWKDISIEQTSTSSYDAFGILVKTGDDTILHFYRQGTSHYTDKGKIVKRTYTISTGLWSVASDVFEDSAYDCRDAAGGIIGNKIFLFFTRFNHTANSYVDLGYIESTDLTGNSWGSRVSLPTTADYRYNHHGGLIHVSGEIYLQPWYEHNGSGNWKVRLYKTIDSGESWSTVTVYSGATNLCEPTIVSIGDSKLIALMGINNGGYVVQATSSDNGDNWSEVSDTNLGVASGKKIPYVIYDSETGNVIIIYHDRGENKTKIAEANANTIFNSATSWDTPEEIDFGFEYNGYPSIVKIESGKYFFVYSKQISSSDADIWGGEYPNKWSSVGTPTVSGGVVSLNDDDAILGKTSFGYNHAVIAKAKADEQDIRFIMFGDAIGLNCQNRVGITSSDFVPDVDNFERMDYFATKDGFSAYGHTIAGDFRNTYFNYQVRRVDGQVDYYQGSTFLASVTDVDGLPTVDLKVKAIVWDNSQESTLDIDWVLVRKYTSTEPTAATTSSFRGYDKIFTGITNTISATDYVSYSAEPSVSNLVNFTATPLSGSVDVTATDTLIDLDYQNSTLTGLSVNNIDREINFNNNDSSSMVIIPASGSIDTSITTWNTSETYYKKWTETGDGSLGNTSHTIGNLKANTYYTVEVDTTRLNTYFSNGSGEISFTYTNGYSSHDFEVKEDITSNSSGGSLPQDAYSPPAMPNPSDDNPKGGFNIIINNGLEQTDNQIVALKLFGGIDAKKMIISENSDFKNSIQEPYQETRQWSLSYGDGLKTVYVKFYTKYGVASEIISDSIILGTSQKETIPIEPETIIENKPAEKTSLPKTSIKENIALNPIAIVKNLKWGSNNNQVVQLQDKLKQLNLFPKEIKSNGNFGPATIQAVKEFQKSVGIYPCGIVGPRTRKALNNQEFITNKDYRFVKDLKYNDKEEEVKQLQTRLRDQSFFPYYVESTGWFGPITKTAVKLFQKFHGIIENGIVGKLVRKRLNF